MQYDFCEQIDRHICFNRDFISCCTVGNNEKNQCLPVIVEKYNGEKIDWNDFFNNRESDKQSARNGEVRESCRGCQYIENREWDYINTRREFKYIQFSHWLKCNSDC